MLREKTAASAPVFPDNEFLQNYSDSDWCAMISVLQIQNIIGNDTWELGDSGIYITFDEELETGPDGISQLIDMSHELAGMITEALPSMSKDYENFYRYFLNDFQKNGFIMPLQGRLI